MTRTSRTDDALRAGDIVVVDDRDRPRFEVIAVRGALAWVRDVETGSDHVAQVARCRPASHA